ncbi:twin-arginine translocase subunit TatC [Haematospirillum jordaniae]|uniref:Sec-independent protein translocase protein TatC n=2 Tax=Haematospirillum jordaniae TaxID=1549855 RepID=A0A143DEY3_9PROT|nr:twin-arginine translocase subunit TatC [Haematospirillum jordaniae]AMW35226.1 preprotein translocase subunit TatC [Haematospirillum jordaniae]
MYSSPSPDEFRMPLLGHLIELRRRILLCGAVFILSFAACYSIADSIYGFLIRPLATVMAELGGSQRMIYTALTEAFFTYIKVAMFGAVVLSFPFSAFQLWRFVAPGLYRREKRAFLPSLIASPLLFAGGAALVYYFVMPVAWRFLLGFQTSVEQTVLPVQLEAKIGEYLDLVMKLILAFGFCFQLPVVLTLLARAGMISSSALVAKRRYAIVAVFIVAGIVTPPDVISQIGLALPLLLLYECSIWSARLVERHSVNDNQDDPDHSDAMPTGKGPDETDFNG